MKPVIMKKTNILRKLSFIMAFVLAFAQMPQTGLLLAYAEPAQERVSSPDEKVPEQESVSVPDAVSGNDAKENEEPVSGEEETVSDGSVSDSAAGESEETVSPAQVKTESEDAAGGVEYEVSTWAELQNAFSKGGVVAVKLSENITAAEGDEALAVPENAHVTLDLSGNTLDRNCKSGKPEGYVIIIKEDAELTIVDTSVDKKGCITGGNEDNAYGGGIHVKGTLTLENGHISGNYSKYWGGGVYVRGGTFNMKGGSIENNTSDEEGGGVYVYDSSFNMEGGRISGNIAARNGGGVYVGAINSCGASFVMTGGEICGNKSEDGGGVYAAGEDGSTVSFNMTGGSIKDNQASDWGGGVMVKGYGDTVRQFNMTGGTIENNTAKYGGAVYVRSTYGTASFNMAGGTIDNNEASEDGGGVYVAGDAGGTALFNMTGGTIDNNEAKYGGAIYAHGNGGTVSVNMTGGDISENHSEKTGGGVMVLSEKSDYSEQGGKAYFTMEGGSIKDNSAKNYGGGIGTGIEPGCTTVVTLNDGSIEGNSAKEYSGGGVYVNTCTFNMNGGRISENTAAEKGGGVYCKSKGGGASFKLNNGKIDKNRAKNGGGVYVFNEGAGSYAEFTMNAGEIKDNQATEKGGGVRAGCEGGDRTSVGRTSIFMNGGSIKNNTASQNGGGIYSSVNQHCVTEIYLKSGSSVQNNTAGNGGGIYSSWNRLYLQGGEIKDNAAYRDGGGIYVDCAQLSVSSGSIQDNTAKGNGGGVYARYYQATQFNISGNFAIKGNKSEAGVSSNVCMADDDNDPEKFRLNVTGKLENTDPIGVRMIDHDSGEPMGGVITRGLSGNGTLSNFAGEGGRNIEINSDGEAVYMIPLEGISVPASKSVEIGKTVAIPVVFTPEGATNKNVTWTVSDSKIATVSDGNVTGVAEGTTIVTAKSEEGGFEASCTVTVTKPAPEPTPKPVDPTKKYHTVTFLNEGKEIEKQTVEDGKTAKEPASAPSKAGYSFLGWASGSTIFNFNTAIHSDITLNAKYIASAPETVSDNSGSGKDPVPVIDPVTRTIYLVKGQSYTAGGTGWTSSDKTIAKVAANTGKITAVKKGKTTVTDEQQNTYNVTVAEPAFERESKSATVVVGETVSLKLVINSPDSESDKEYPVTWDSSNTKAATVADGVVTAVGKGSANIRAYIGGKTYTAKVSVKDTYATPKKQTEKSISFNMNPLQSFNLKYDTKVFKVNGAVWSGDGMEPTKGKNGNPDGGYSNKVVLITKAGKFTAIGKGTTKITGKDADNNEVSVTVTVKPVSTKETTYININKTETIKFPKVNNSKAVWKSSNEKVIKDCAKGKVKGLAVGQSTISCTYNDFDFSTVVYVEDPAFKTDSVLIKNGNSYEMTLDAGKVYNRVRMDNVFQTVTCKSSKSSVAFIDENGVIYARKAGTANITTKINGKTYRIKVKVK